MRCSARDSVALCSNSAGARMAFWWLNWIAVDRRPAKILPWRTPPMSTTPLHADTLDTDGLPVDIGAAGREKRLQRRVLHEPGVRTLIFARFCTALGLTTLAYGVMVYLATIGTSQAIISLVGATRFLTALLFGLGGGLLAGATSSRSALVTT